MENFQPPDNVCVIYNTKATFNEEIICYYLSMAFADKPNSVLIYDSARCHLTNSVAARARELGISRVIIPPRTTNLLQPADVSWFATIKRAYCSRWTEWAVNEPKSTTAAGNTRSPGYVNAINWLSDIWRAFPVEQIKQSFDNCGITSQLQLHSTLFI